MSNFNKHKTYFYTLFRNVPYTDEEWERENAHRQKLQDDARVYVKYKEKYHVLKTRPVHRFRHGPSAHSHEEAKAICEKALAAGAQLVSYTVYATNGAYPSDEQWIKGRTGDWKQLVRKRYKYRFKTST